MPDFMGATLLLCSKLLNLMNQCKKPTVKGMFLFFIFTVLALYMYVV